MLHYSVISDGFLLSFRFNRLGNAFNPDLAAVGRIWGEKHWAPVDIVLSRIYEVRRVLPNRRLQ